ncbi:unnamed protein product [Ectocarpus sp. 8 AP-2014]
MKCFLQHEGDNFFLDVMELRTFDSAPATVVSDGDGDSPSPGYPSAAPRPPRNGTPVGPGHDNDNDDVTRNGVSNHDHHDGNGSPHDDAGRRVRQDDNGSPCGEAGRKVRLVGLLGDLDLEVEFCSPHAPLPPSPAPHSGTERNGHNATRRGPADEGGASIGEVSRDPARFPIPASSSLVPRPPPPSSSDQVFAGKESSMESGDVGPTLSLPAPATAKRSSGDDRSAGSGLEPLLWRAGHLGIKPPVPPSSRYSSRVSKRQPFSGKGVPLSGGMATATPNPGNGVATAGREDELPEAGEAPPAEEAQARAVGIQSYSKEDVEPRRGSSVGRHSAKEAVESSRGSGDSCPRRVVVDRLEVSRKSAFSPQGTNEARGAVEGRILGTGALVASTASSALGTRGDGSATETESSRGQRSSGGDGGLAGVRLAEAPAAAAAAAVAMVTFTCGSCGKLVPAANQQLHALRCRPSPSTAGRRPRRGGGTIPPPDDAPPVAAAEQPQPTAARQDTAARESTAAAAASASPVPPFTCAYCGLSFRTTIAAGDHEALCAARTERCGRCCGLVPRGDAEAHRRPGGGCDAAIAAAAEREEAQAIATVVGGGGRGGVGATGLGLVGSAVGGAEPSGSFNGHLDPGGRFDALLAEALSSSKAATAVLADARAKNAARMAAGAGSPTGTGTGSRPHRASGGGGGGEHGSRVKTGPVSGNEAAALAVPSAPVGSGGPTPSTVPGADISVTTPGEGDRYERPSPRQFGVGRGTDGEEEEEDRAVNTGHLRDRPWTCSRCTLMNPRHAEACEACGSTVWSEENDSEKQPGGEGTERAGTKPPGAFETPPCSVASSEAPAMGVVAPSVGDAVSARPPHSERSSSPKGAMPRAAEAAAGGVAVSRARFLTPQAGVVVEKNAASLKAPRAEPQSPPPAGAVPDHGLPSGLDDTRGAGGLVVNHSPRSTAAAAAAAAGERGVVHATSPSAGRGEALLHPLLPRRNTALVVPENANALQQQQQRRQQWHRRRRGENAGAAQRADRRTGGNRQQQGSRRRPGRHPGARLVVTMGPPRRLGGVHRPSPMMRLSSLSPSLSSAMPPDLTRPIGPVAAAAGASAATAAAAEAVMSAALASSGDRSGGSGMDRRHGHRLPYLVSSSAPLPLASSRGGGGLDSGGGGGGGRRAGGGSGGGSRSRRRDAGGNTSDVSRRIPPDPGPFRATPPIAPACDISLSILGRRSSQRGVGLEPGEVATETRPPRTSLSVNEVSLVAPLQRVMRDAAGGGGDVAVGWGKREGGRVRAGVGIAPSKLRRRVSDTRLLEPL